MSIALFWRRDHPFSVRSRDASDYFGAAIQTKPSGEKDTDLWSHRPWPFSLEVKSGLVTSVRIADPTYQG
jgi:hypothetical protein